MPHRAVFVRVMAAMFLSSWCCGCSGGSGMSLQPGLYAYSGTAIEQSAPLLGGAIGGEETNRLDMSKWKQPADRYEKIRVFVDKSDVEAAATATAAFTTEQLGALMDKAASGAVTQFGRFERVPSKDQAEIVLRARLYNVNAWSDSSVSDGQLAGSGANTAGTIVRKVSKSIAREGMDAFVEVYFGREDGTEFASARAVGRLVATQGSVIESGELGTQSGAGTSARQTMTVANAKLKDTELARCLAEAVDGAIATAVRDQLEAELWESSADRSGVRPARHFPPSKTVGRIQG